MEDVIKIFRSYERDYFKLDCEKELKDGKFVEDYVWVMNEFWDLKDENWKLKERL